MWGTKVVLPLVKETFGETEQAVAGPWGWLTSLDSGMT